MAAGYGSRRREVQPECRVTKNSDQDAASSLTVACSGALISAESFSIAATAAGPALRSQYTPMTAAIQIQNDEMMPIAAISARLTPKPP